MFKAGLHNPLIYNRPVQPCNISVPLKSVILENHDWLSTLPRLILQELQTLDFCKRWVFVTHTNHSYTRINNSSSLPLCNWLIHFKTYIIYTDAWLEMNMNLFYKFTYWASVSNFIRTSKEAKTSLSRYFYLRRSNDVIPYQNWLWVMVNSLRICACDLPTLLIFDLIRKDKAEESLCRFSHTSVSIVGVLQCPAHLVTDTILHTSPVASVYWSIQSL